jgi:hypothetical protein
MAYLLAGPFVALVGIAAVFFVLRRKSVEKRSMYSARRSQIEHKVRAARQRTLAPHGHAEKPPEPSPAAVSPFATAQAQPAATYEAPAFQAPPVAPPTPIAQPQPSAEPPPWEQPSTPAPAPSTFDFPSAQPEPYMPAPAPVEPFRPATEPAQMPAPSEPVWTPAPEPRPAAERVAPAASTASPATSSSAAGGWSIVSTAKDPAVSGEPASKKKKNKAAAAGSEWQLASGDSAGTEEDEPGLKRPSGTVMAIAQYAVLVVGLVMVLIGVLVMVANSHVT